jgi:hypothetical protein
METIQHIFNIDDAGEEGFLILTSEKEIKILIDNFQD